MKLISKHGYNPVLLSFTVSNAQNSSKLETELYNKKYMGTADVKQQN
jgi:hypothetical protein